MDTFFNILTFQKCFMVVIIQLEIWKNHKNPDVILLKKLHLPWNVNSQSFSYEGGREHDLSRKLFYAQFIPCP